MCTRYYMERSPELKPYVDRAMASPLRQIMISKLGQPLKTEGEIRPTDMVPVIAPDAKTLAPSVYPMVWGFTNPKGGSPLVNARIETAKEKPLWKESWNRRRCIVPASFYFEWEHMIGLDGSRKTSQKYLIKPKTSPITFLAGLYRIETWENIQIPVFTILTREPGETIRFIHDRMHDVLPGNAAKAWIHPDSNPGEILCTALTEMVFDKMN